jgi:hypothetical protein
MRPDYLLCDRCGSKMDERPLSIFEGRETDAAGDSDNFYFHIDLCQKCLCTVIERFFNKVGRPNNDEFINHIKKESKQK